MSAAEVQASFKRCELTGDFAETFYSIFLDASDDIAPLFANTDFRKQRALLRGTVFMMVMKDVDDARANGHFVKVGESHSSGRLDIKPELYEVWLDSLCATVKKLDPEWTEALETQWWQKMRPAIALITSMY